MTRTETLANADKANEEIDNYRKAMLLLIQENGEEFLKPAVLYRHPDTKLAYTAHALTKSFGFC